MDIIDFIQLQLSIFEKPFMHRAIIAGIIISIICGTLGVFLTLKKKSYMSDGIAHASLSGVAFALVFTSSSPLIFAMIVAIIMSIGITYLKKNSKIESDSIIGIMASMLFALGIIILNTSNSFQPEISTYLFGKILSVSWSDLLYSFIVFSIVVIFVSFFYEKIVYATFDEESAKIRGINTTLLEYAINILIAISIVTSVKVVGIVMVTGMLIIPASHAKLIARKFSYMIPIAIIHNIVSVLLGILLSSFFNVPSGAMIILVSGVIFFISFFVKKLFSKE